MLEVIKRKRGFRCTLGESLRLARNDANGRAGIVALGGCFRASAGILERGAFTEVERHQILDVGLCRAQRQFGENVA